MYVRILLAVMILLILPVSTWARAYLIVVDENYLKTPNYENAYTGIPLPVITELKQYFKAKVDIAGINLNDVNPLTRYTRENYDLIITVGYEISEIGRTAALNHQRQKFALIGTYRSSTLPENAVGYRFNTGIGAFMAGYMAAKVSERGHIAFIGGKKDLNILDLAKCFTDGAKLADPEINVSTEYISGFFDPRLALTRANDLFNGPTDVIFHAAEYSGQGVLQAAQRTKKWTIGLNTDLYVNLDNTTILTSVVADYNMAIMEACMLVESGNFKGGESVLLTLSNYGVGLGNSSNVPKEILQEVEKLKTDILNSDVKIRNYNNKLLK